MRIKDKIGSTIDIPNVQLLSTIVQLDFFWLPPHIPNADGSLVPGATVSSLQVQATWKAFSKSQVRKFPAHPPGPR